MTLARMAATLNLQANAERLMAYPQSERKRLALRAIQERDEEGLWELMLGHLVLYGRAGAKVSPQTLRKYRAALKAYWAWAESRGVTLHRPMPDAGVAYIRALEAQGFKRNTVGWNLAGCRLLYATLRWSGIESDPFRDVSPRRDPVPRHKKGKPYTTEQVEKLLEYADPQEAVIILLGAHCGLRVGEMVTVQRSNVLLDEEPPVLRFVGKGDKPREVELSQRAEDAVRRWLKMTPSLGPWLLSYRTIHSVEQHLQKLCALADVPYQKRGVHGLRRTAGSQMYEQTQDLLETRDFLGHASAVTTEVYVGYVKDRKKPKNRDW